MADEPFDIAATYEQAEQAAVMVEVMMWEFSLSIIGIIAPNLTDADWLEWGAEQIYTTLMSMPTGNPIRTHKSRKSPKALDRAEQFRNRKRNELLRQLRAEKRAAKKGRVEP